MLLLVSVEARLEWAVSAGRPSFSSENETPFVRLARSQLLQCDDRQMCKATTTQKRLKRLFCYKRCERENDECCVVEERSDANDKKTSFGIPYPINNPPIRAGMQKKKCSSKLHSGQKTLKNVSHFFFHFCELQFKLSFDKNLGVLNHRNFFSIFSHCVKSTHLMLCKNEKNYALYASGRGF